MKPTKRENKQFQKFVAKGIKNKQRQKEKK